jgi:hypothetical protein
MALQLNAASGYDDVFWTNVLKKIEALINDSSTYGHVYIAPTMQDKSPQSVRIWGDSADSEVLKHTEWIKRYNANISLYMISESPTENFYRSFYEQSEVLYQVMANNNTVTGALGWYDGVVEDIIYDELDSVEEGIDGLHKASFDFSCLVNRITTATINL